MASATASSGGFATEMTFEHYTRLTTAGAGLMIAEYAFVHTSGRSEEHQLGISSDEHIPGLRKIAKIIQRSGSVAGIQLSHGGGKSSQVLTGGKLMGPSAIAVPIKGEQLEIPSPMTEDEIALWQTAFAAAIDRAVAAGFELIELHSAHGYGLNQWLSPITNHRHDNYGRTLAGRSKMLLEIVRATRIAHPNLLISVRMPGQDFLPGGLSPSDMIALAKILVDAGADVLHVSSGIGGWRRPTERMGEGYLVQEAAQIQAHVAAPVIGVGGIETGQFIDQCLQEKKLSLAAVGRGILTDPEGWRSSQMQETKVTIGGCYQVI